MSIEALLILLGVLVALSPFLGLPHAWVMGISLILGIAVIAIGVMLRTRKLQSRRIEEHHQPTIEVHEETLVAE